MLYIRLFGIIIYTCFELILIKSEIKLFQRDNAYWPCFQIFKKWIENLSNSNNDENLTVWYYNLHMYMVSSWLSSRQKSSYFKEKTWLEYVFRFSKSKSKNSPIAIMLHIWLFGISIIYTCIVFRVDSHQVRNQTISNRKRELSLFLQFQKLNR